MTGGGDGGKPINLKHFGNIVHMSTKTFQGFSGDLVMLRDTVMKQIILSNRKVKTKSVLIVQYLVAI